MSSAPVAHSKGWPLTARATALLIAGCVATGVAGGLILRPTARSVSPTAAGTVLPPRSADAVWRAGQRAAPEFALRDQSGRLVSLQSRRGRAVLLAFMDSRCKLMCTLEGPTIHRALSALGRRARVSLLVVSVNPWEDTPTSIRAAGAKYRFSGDWHWLGGSAAALRPVWRAYGIAVLHTADDVSHSSSIYLIDGRGWERAGFNFPFTGNAVAHGLRPLVSRGGA